MNNRNKAIFWVALCIAFFCGCAHRCHIMRAKAEMNSVLPEALPHGNILNVVDDIYFVMGTNVIVHDGIRIQSSRTMTITRENGELTLVNSIRLNDAGLKELEKLGRIKNVIRLGAFHGRDDAFYQRAYGAKLWASPQMEFIHGEVLDHDLGSERLPISRSRIIEFDTTKFKEFLLLLERSGGILIACDSIKNWQKKDQFFDNITFEMMRTAGSIGAGKIDATWLQAMSPSKEGIKAIGDLAFTILLSAHGEPLKNRANQNINSSIRDAELFLEKMNMIY